MSLLYAIVIRATYIVIGGLISLQLFFLKFLGIDGLSSNYVIGIIVLLLMVILAEGRERPEAKEIKNV